MAVLSQKPERTCVGCFKKFPQSQLVAVRRQKNNDVVFDFAQRFTGRSAYLCQNVICLQRATKRKGKNALEYGLKISIPANIFEELEQFFSNKKL